MKKANYPEKTEWDSLCKRPGQNDGTVDDAVAEILRDVKQNGDAAIRKLSEKFDGYCPENFLLASEELAQAGDALSEKLKGAIDLAAANIHKFHESQIEGVKKVETTPGVLCWRKSLPIERVGLYVPGGTAPLFSTLLMLGIPARIAGCKEIVVCTPPGAKGKIHPAIRYVANLIGIEKVYTIGGAQAIAAMAFGTETVPRVDKIFGPGNAFVTKAKQKVQEEGVAIDMPAGPSEVLVVADAKSNPAFVAADLLSQAEHGSDSQVMLVVSDENGDAGEFLDELERQIAQQLENLPRRNMAGAALRESAVVRFNTNRESVEFSNRYAPEHLIISTDAAGELAELVTQAGSVFIGPYSCESAGDYASGTNHTLPTNGYARNYSGVSLDSFVKKITFQELSADGISNIGRAVELLAEAEELQAHKNAVTLRLKSLENV